MALQRLETQHYIAIQYLAQPNKGGKTYAEIAEECGVHPNTIANWRKDELFNRELQKQMKRNVLELVPDVSKAMYDEALKNGNAAAAKLILTMAEMLTDKIEVDTNVKADMSDIAALKERIEAYKKKASNNAE